MFYGTAPKQNKNIHSWLALPLWSFLGVHTEAQKSNTFPRLKCVLAKNSLVNGSSFALPGFPCLRQHMRNLDLIQVVLSKCVSFGAYQYVVLRFVSSLLMLASLPPGCQLKTPIASYTLSLIIIPQLSSAQCFSISSPVNCFSRAEALQSSAGRQVQSILMPYPKSLVGSLV